jgi:hypothetical protein
MRRLADRLRELRQRLVFHWRVFLHALLRVPAITTPPAGPKLIVSLTTYSRRLHLVHRTVESLVAQSSRPDALIVWIWSGDLPNGELPRPLARLQKLGVTVRVVDEDLRSYKKLVHALEEFSGHHLRRRHHLSVFVCRGTGQKIHGASGRGGRLQVHFHQEGCAGNRSLPCLAACQRRRTIIQHPSYWSRWHSLPARGP